MNNLKSILNFFYVLAFVASFTGAAVAQEEIRSGDPGLSISASVEKGIQARLGFAGPVFGFSALEMSAFSIDQYMASGALVTIEFESSDGDLKKVSDKDIKKIDAHKFKEDFVGKENVSKYNIYKDNDGKIVLVPVKKDSGLENVETGMTWDEVLEDYPAKKKGQDAVELPQDTEVAK